MDQDQLNVLMNVWLCLVGAGALFFVFSRSARFKSRAWAPYLLGIGSVLVSLAWLAGFRGPILYTFATFVLVFVAVLAWGTRFCSSCGSTALSRSGLTPQRSCSKCGHIFK